MNFRKYILFPVSTFAGAIFSALVIIASGTLAIILLIGGFFASLFLGYRHRGVDALGQK